jgi:uncharacterized protein (TIGR03643 family)
MASCETVLRILTMQNKELTEAQIDRIIEMAWEDRTPFEAITYQFGLSEQETITLMRREMKPSSFRMWRARVQGRATKHAQPEIKSPSAKPTGYFFTFVR